MRENASELIDRLQKSVSIVQHPLVGWLILALSVALTVWAYWFTSEQVRIRAEERFEFRAEGITNAIYERMYIYDQVLYGASGLFKASNEVSRDEWQRYVSSLNLSIRLPGIQGLGYAVVVDNKDKHIAEVRAQGFPDYTIKPPGDRGEYTSIIYLEPFDWRNKRAFGYDMWSNPLRQKAMARARDEGELATSAKITLVQETDKDVQYGFLTYMPVYSGSSPPATLDSRRSQLVGWVYAAFRAGDLMAGILNEGDTEISFEIYDGDSLEPQSLLFSSGGQSSRREYEDFFSLQRTMTLQGQQWTLFLSASRNKLFPSSHAAKPKYILIAGIVVDLLLFYALLSLHFVNRHVSRTAQELKKDFEINQQGLILQARLVDASEKEAEAFFEMAPEAFLVVSKAGRVVKANKYAHELFGYESGEMKELYLEQLVPEEYRAGHADLRFSYFVQPSARQMSKNRSLFALKKAGDKFPATINLEPIEYRGEIHVVAVVHDVSQQHLLEKTMAEAKEKAESASRSKSDFVANMSHEIRTPLNAVLGAAKLLGKTEPNSLQLKYINMIRSSGEALLGVINDILDFSKIEAGRMELSSVSFDLCEVLSRVGMMMSMSAGEKDIELVIRVDSDVANHLVGDPLRLQQVLINLASNAIKFTDRGSVVLAVTSFHKGNDGSLQQLTFSISDTGIGITSEQIERLFNAFAQADESITRRFGGTGLGLAISNQIVEMMDSRIQVVSKIDEGATFSFEVEMPVGDDGKAHEQLLTDHVFKVLMIDDSPESCSVVKQIISSLGFYFCAYSSWDEAQSALDGSVIVKEFDFVILDWHLLDDTGEGIEALKMLDALRQMGLKSSCASILVSSHNQCASLLVDGMQKSFDSGLIKPILRPWLLDSLHEAALKRTGKGVVIREHEESYVDGKIQGVNILLVEDNIFNQTIAQGLLEDMGGSVEIANNGSEALACYKQGGKIDIILMDIQMPIMDGLTATQILRSELNCQIPIIAMTAGVLKSERDKYLSAGMDDFVAKPIDEKELFSAINSALFSANTKEI